VVRGREAQGKEGVEGNIPVNAPTITLVTYIYLTVMKQKLDACQSPSQYTATLVVANVLTCNKHSPIQIPSTSESPFPLQTHSVCPLTWSWPCRMQI
jgi:hypothetical protein